MWWTGSMEGAWREDRGRMEGGCGGQYAVSVHVCVPDRANSCV